MAPLTAREQRFVQEYLIDLNGAAAARRAGFAAAGANKRAFALLRRANIAAAVAAGMDARSRAAKISADEVLAALARIGFADVRRMFAEDGSLVPWAELDADVAAAISQVEVTTRPAKRGESTGEILTKIRFSDRRQALIELGKHLGMFPAGKKGPPKTKGDFGDSALNSGGGRSETGRMELSALSPKLPLDSIETAARISSLLEDARRRREAAAGETDAAAAKGNDGPGVAVK